MEIPQSLAPLPRRYRSDRSPALGERGLGCPAQFCPPNPQVIGCCPDRGLVQLLSPLSPSLPQFPQCLGKLQPCVSSPEQDSLRHHTRGEDGPLTTTSLSPLTSGQDLPCPCGAVRLVLKSLFQRTIGEIPALV